MPPGVSFGSFGSPSTPGGLSRRALLVCGAGATAGFTGVLAACSGSDDSDAADAAASAAALGLSRRAARDSSELLARYDATARAHPALDSTLAPFRDVVTAHLAALSEPRARRQDTAPPSGAAPEVPAEQAAAVTELADAERRTADARYRAMAEAPPDMARLLASLAAAGSVQAYLLSEARA
jgi:hypothetical protein